MNDQQHPASVRLKRVRAILSGAGKARAVFYLKHATDVIDRLYAQNRRLQQSLDWRPTPESPERIAKLEQQLVEAGTKNLNERRERQEIFHELLLKRSELAEVRSLQARKDDALRLARAKFREYEALHLAKHSEEGEKKALTNRIMAEQMDEALATKTGQPVPTLASDIPGQPGLVVVYRGLWEEASAALEMIRQGSEP